MLAKNMSEPEVFDARPGSCHVFWFSSCSRIRCKGETSSFPVPPRILELMDRPWDSIFTKGAGEVTKEKVRSEVVQWSLELRIGWEIWSLWSAFWRRGMSRGLEMSNASTAMPVPPRTALHQFNSVPPRLRLCPVIAIA